MLPAVERQLGARLAAVLRLVPRTSRVVADVGCDHFQLGMALALDDARGSRLVTRVIGVDKAAAPLEVARRGLGRLPGATRGVREGGVVEVGGRVLELRLGDGLRAMSKADGVDCVAIAGMGTRNMVEEVLAGPAAGEVLGGVRHLVLQAYDPRPLFMLDLRTHLTTTLRDAHLGPGGAGYAIVDESIVRADDRVFITLLAEAAAASQGDGGRIGEEEDGGGKEDDEAFRRLLLGRHLGRRAREEPETRALYGEYLTHHRQWFAKLVAARGRGSGGQQEAVGAMNPTVRALATIERELAGLELNRNGT